MDPLALTLTITLIIILIFFVTLLLLVVAVLTRVYKFIALILSPIFNLFKSPW